MSIWERVNIPDSYRDENKMQGCGGRPTAAKTECCILGENKA